MSQSILSHPRALFEIIISAKDFYRTIDSSCIYTGLYLVADGGCSYIESAIGVVCETCASFSFAKHIVIYLVEN